MADLSIADAKAQLTRIIQRVEQGETVHITWRSKPVAVPLSEDEYARLRKTAERADFCRQIVDMRSDPDFEPVDLSREEVDP
jgi:prevent-host-death family protein